MEPLYTFITSRELEQRLPAMTAHLKSAEERSELRFSEAIVASLWFRWEGKKSMAHIGLWESGDCIVEIVETLNGEYRPFRHKRCQTREEFYHILWEMIATVSLLEGITDPVSGAGLSVSNLDRWIEMTESDTYRITSKVVYSQRIRSLSWDRSTYHPSQYLACDSDQWAIIPTHRGKSSHCLFYGSDGLPKEVTEVFLNNNSTCDFGFSIIYKRVIGINAQDGLFYKKYSPDHVKAKKDEIWGDFYYASFYTSIHFAIERGCKSIVLFPTFGNMFKWLWASFIRAAHNAMLAHKADYDLLICQNCGCLDQSLPDYCHHEELLEVPDHKPIGSLFIDQLQPDLSRIRFQPVSRNVTNIQSRPRK